MASTTSHQATGNRRDWTLAAREYYRDPAVRARIREFLGVRAGASATAAYVSAGDASGDEHAVPLEVSQLDQCLDEEKEIYRSLWDRRYLIADVDLEYVNFDFAGEQFQNFEVAAYRQRPVSKAILALCRRFGIAPLHIMSGRGPHFLWQIAQNSKAFSQLTELGKTPPSLQSKYDQPLPPSGESIGPHLGNAFAGLGLVLEYICHLAFQSATRATSIPLTLTAVETVSRRGVRESVSLDISEYADPLHTRVIRVPFSVYYKPMQQASVLGADMVRQIPLLSLVPVQRHAEQRALYVARSLIAARQLARHTSVHIPEQSTGMTNLIASYRHSALARIHRWFYAQEHDDFRIWKRTYDATDLSALPPSGRRILQAPNDLLLKPACLRHVVRLFLALGWHPRHIAGLVRSKFERDFGWGKEWYLYDAASRADFYCRLFTGLIVRGLDDLSDFRCPPVSQLFGPARDWNEDFEPFKNSLTRRIKHDRLASRPFHRLFL